MPKAVRSASIAGLSYKDKDGKIIHNPEREMIQDMDTLPWVADVYKRDLQIEKYFIGYLQHPYVSHLHRPRLPGAMHFLPLAADHRRAQISRPFAAKCRRRNGLHEENFSRKCSEFFFDDDTFTANLPRAREIAKKLAPLGLTW